MSAWLLNGVYLALLSAVAPLVAWRAWRHGRYRRGWRERLYGKLPKRESFTRPLVWVHAVSVGEILLLPPVLRRIAAQHPGVRIVVSTSTDAAYDVARAKLPDCEVTWFPLDFSWAVHRAVRRMHPDLVVLVELELWPNFIRAVKESGAALALINGRLSHRSFRGYGRLRRWMRPLLRRFDALAVQTPEYAARFADLGALADRIAVTGSIKFDGLNTQRHSPDLKELRAALEIDADALVFIAGSTQSPEEQAALEAWEAARQLHPQLRLLLVPRHRERFDEVAAMVTARGWPLRRRSRWTPPVSGDRPPVILIDTVGELAALWGLADVAYVGGSLAPGRGGQNMLEPAACGAAVLFGPYTENFHAVVDGLRRDDAAQVVHSAEELTAHLLQLLNEPERRRRLGENAQRYVAAHQGAADRTIAALLPLLPMGGPHARAA